MASAKGAGDTTSAMQARADPALDEKDLDQVSHRKAADQIIHQAKTATENERTMTLMQGIKLYPKAIAWSVLISTCIVMEGYDVCLINNFYAFPQFNRKYGVQLPNGEWQVPAAWQAGLSNVSAPGDDAEAVD
jgi:SP family general alpha glucoside:H+ symporter-like MFS transporter